MRRARVLVQVGPRASAPADNPRTPRLPTGKLAYQLHSHMAENPFTLESIREGKMAYDEVKRRDTAKTRDAK